MFFQTLKQQLRSSFFWPMQWLSAPQRHAMRAFYGFCRLTDDITDGTLEIAQKQRQLDDWEAEIHRLCAKEPPKLANPALAEAITCFKLPQSAFIGILNGMRMDIAGTMLRPSRAELATYCHGVASCVGLAAIHIFGSTDDDSQRFANALGQSLQRINILRDILTDAQMGRIYLPQEWLAKVGLPNIQPADLPNHLPTLRPVLDQLANEADAYHQQALDSLTANNRAALRPALLMNALYQPLLTQMRADGWRYRTPYRLNQTQRLWIVGHQLISRH